ncbi:MAG: pantoate--beta-alanine ligase [Candidatus Krumholzibacteria bacterium]|nr:pantoate--beta-alanine ligase [Candidatus Krumholzibacteria bacterium]
MKKAQTQAEVHGFLRGVRQAGKRVGFVPTMGSLHEGHRSLVRLARESTDFVVVSIFVNPKQFGPSEDFKRYPRDEERDIEILEELGCDLLFLPTSEDIYSSCDRTKIEVEGLSEVLCGDSRPGHFEGVVLVVAKLFNIVCPDEAFLGQKDAQQAVIIQRMAADLDFPVRIVIGPTVREADGLAMSSRNACLSGDERKRASTLYKALVDTRRKIEQGARDPEELKSMMRRTIEGAGFEIDYVEIADGATLEHSREIEGILLLAVAGRLGGTRLIDNIALKVSGSEVEEVLLQFPEWSRYGR